MIVLICVMIVLTCVMIVLICFMIVLIGVMIVLICVMAVLIAQINKNKLVPGRYQTQLCKIRGARAIPK